MRRSKKWSKIRNSAEGLLASILGYNTAALAVLSCSSRWSVPLPVECRQEGEGGAFVLPISDVQAVKSTRSDVFSLSLNALPALPAVASMADPPCHNTAEGSERMQPESEADGVGRNTAVDLRPQSQAEFFRTMTTPDAIAWVIQLGIEAGNCCLARKPQEEKEDRTGRRGFCFCSIPIFTWHVVGSFPEHRQRQLFTASSPRHTCVCRGREVLRQCHVHKNRYHAISRRALPEVELPGAQLHRVDSADDHLLCTLL